jgi:protocatechuate 3,4-dioxygenase beta subunit
MFMLKCLLPILLLSIGQSSLSQVDPDWLKAWNLSEAQKPTTLSSIGRIASNDEPGEPFVIKGRVFLPNDEPATGVIVHAYHRDKDGFDFGKNDRETATWRLQGWVKTDENGRFTYHTIRPAADHLGREGAHIHFTTISETYGRQWAPKVFLADDPLVPQRQRELSDLATPYGWVREVSMGNDGQQIEVRIRLKRKGDF